MDKLLLLLTISMSSILAGPLEQAYQAGTAAAQAHQKQTLDSIKHYNPADKFTNYTAQPAQTGYYHGVNAYSTQDLSAAGAREAVYSEEDASNTAVQAAKKAFHKNPKEKINPNDPWLSRSGQIMHNAADIALGTSSKPGEVLTGGAKAGVNCQEEKICRVELIKKTCNEAKTVRKICDKVPNIAIHGQNVIYQNCHKVVITQGASTHCPVGYRQIVYSDMLRPVTHDDIRICLKEAMATENVECFGGYLIHGLAHPDIGDKDVKSTERTMVPKNMRARIRFSHLFSPHMIMTIINETTGQVLYDKSPFNNGQVIELPVSSSQDQVFRFYDHGALMCAGRFFCSDWGYCCGKGVMILYIDHINSIKIANISWSEVNCHEE